MSEEFGSIGESAHIRMRELAKATKSQRRVWQEVEEKGFSLQVTPSSTHALSKALEDRDVKKSMKPYYDELSRIPEIAPTIFGVVAVEGDQVLVCDLFTSHSLFERLWPKLLRSYVLDVMDRPKRGGSLSRKEIKNFIREALDANIESGVTDGVGRAVEFSTNRVLGSALIDHDNVVHFDLFPKRDILLRDSSMDLEFRRQRTTR